LRYFRSFYDTLRVVTFHEGLTLACTLVANVFVGMSVLVAPILAPLAAPQIGRSASDAGVFVALVSITGAVAAISSGSLLRRMRPARVMQLSLLACTFGLALLASARIPLVVVASLVLGIGYGIITPACSQILIQVSQPKRRSLIFSVNQTGIPLGGVLAGTLLPPMARSLGWPASSLAVGLGGIALIMMIFALPLRGDLDAVSNVRTEGRQIFAGIMLALKLPRLRRMILPSISFAIIQLCLGTFLVSFLTLNIGFDLKGAGVVLAVAQAAGIGGRVLWGWVADNLLDSQKVLPLIGVLMSVATFLMALFTANSPHAWVIIVAIIQGATAIGWNGIYLGEVARLAPEGQAGAVTGGALSLTLLGSMIGPPLFTMIVEASGSYRLAFDLVGVIAFVSALFYLWSPDQRALARSNPAANALRR
jgi:predicted MFS family arabinose efflux permease